MTTARGGAGVAGMQVRLVGQLDQRRIERGQQAADALGARALGGDGCAIFMGVMLSKHMEEEEA